MKHFQLILIFFLIVVKTNAQAENKSSCRILVEITKEKKSKKEIPKVKINYNLPGEDSTLMKYFEKNIKPSLHLDKISKKGKYLLSVAFILAKDGTLSDIQCELDPGFGICNDVVRIVKKSPRWRPAKPVIVTEYPTTNE